MNKFSSGRFLTLAMLFLIVCESGVAATIQWPREPESGLRFMESTFHSTDYDAICVSLGYNESPTLAAVKRIPIPTVADIVDRKEVIENIYDELGLSKGKDYVLDSANQGIGVLSPKLTFNYADVYIDKGLHRNQYSSSLDYGYIHIDYAVRNTTLQLIESITCK